MKIKKNDHVKFSVYHPLQGGVVNYTAHLATKPTNTPLLFNNSNHSLVKFSKSLVRWSLVRSLVVLVSMKGMNPLMEIGIKRWNVSTLDKIVESMNIEAA